MTSTKKKRKLSLKHINKYTKKGQRNTTELSSDLKIAKKED